MVKAIVQTRTLQVDLNSQVSDLHYTPNVEHSSKPNLRGPKKGIWCVIHSSNHVQILLIATFHLASSFDLLTSCLASYNHILITMSVLFCQGSLATLFLRRGKNFTLHTLCLKNLVLVQGFKFSGWAVYRYIKE